MTAQVNKAGTDWLLVKAEMKTRIHSTQEDMLRLLPPEEYHRLRGAVMVMRELIEWVEPTTPPQTEEDDYGISDPSKEY